MLRTELLTTLDMADDDEATVALRLDHQIPVPALAGTRYVVVGTPKAASRCCRACPELFVAATVRQARDGLRL